MLRPVWVWVIDQWVMFVDQCGSCLLTSVGHVVDQWESCCRPVGSCRRPVGVMLSTSVGQVCLPCGHTAMGHAGLGEASV